MRKAVIIMGAAAVLSLAPTVAQAGTTPTSVIFPASCTKVTTTTCDTAVAPYATSHEAALADIDKKYGALGYVHVWTRATSNYDRHYVKNGASAMCVAAGLIKEVPPNLSSWRFTYKSC